MSAKMLIVDDEKGVVSIIKSYFEMTGFVVYTAFDGKENMFYAQFFF